MRNALREVLQFYGQLDKLQDTAREKERLGKKEARDAARDQEQALTKQIELQSTLARLQRFLGRPEQTAPQEAREAVLQQGAAMRAAVEKDILSITQSPTLTRDAQATLAGLRAGLDALPTAITSQGQQAFERALEQQFMTPLRALGRQFDTTSKDADAFMQAIRYAAQVSGTRFSPEAEAIVREFEKLQKIESQLPELRRQSQ